MSKDISRILADWPHDPADMQVRLVRSADGREKLQVRLDLGLFQMELDGRPDGQRPEGAETVLDVCEARARDAEERSEDYEPDATTLAELFREAFQYYHRYLALFHLGRYDLVARDTARNLRLFAFVVRHATDPRDRLQFDQYRPYVTMMHARALAQRAIDAGEAREALKRIDEGARGIRSFLRDYGHEEADASCRELEFLLDWRRQVERERTVGPVERLEEQLGRAVASEDFEEAARLRDQLRRLRGSPPATHPA